MCHIHRSLMVRIAGFHPADPGSIPGDEVFTRQMSVYTCAREVKGGGHEHRCEKLHWFESSHVFTHITQWKSAGLIEPVVIGSNPIMRHCPSERELLEDIGGDPIASKQG